MKTKLTLDELSIKSFVTDNEKATIQGGKDTMVRFSDQCKYSDFCIEQ
ncbi:MAG: pinensin family lanthipeptide [Cyclobacteriaceae bacterium]